MHVLEAYPIFRSLLAQNVSPHKALAQTIEELDRRYLKAVERLSLDEGSPLHLQYLGAGTCALLAYVDTRDNLLYVANLGDSRAVLGRQCAFLDGLIEAVEVAVNYTNPNPDPPPRPSLKPNPNPNPNPRSQWIII